VNKHKLPKNGFKDLALTITRTWCRAKGQGQGLELQGQDQGFDFQGQGQGLELQGQGHKNCP